jgi:hypothetical protein
MTTNIQKTKEAKLRDTQFETVLIKNHCVGQARDDAIMFVPTVDLLK